MYKNMITVKEVARLIHADPCMVRQMVKDGKILGFVGGSKSKSTFKIPRMKFYRDMGWETDDEIRHGYQEAGLDFEITQKK